MIEKIKALCVKYREFLVYFIVGCLTTLVAAAARFGFNFLFFGGTLHPTFAQNTALAIVDWVAGVAFAYPTNRKWVFQSKNPNILAEAGGFVASRLATLGMDWAVTQLLIERFEEMALRWPEPSFSIEAQRERLLSMP